MGFRQNGYMTVWSTELSKSGNTTRVRLSSSRKNKQTDQYEQDFSGFCTFIGKAHDKAKNLQERDRIKILECDVGTNYDKEKKIEYVNYKVYDFEMADGSAPEAAGAAKEKKATKKNTKKAATVDEGAEGDNNEEELPF